MGKFQFSKIAVDDLNSIWLYSKTKWSVAQADSYYKQIITTCEYLSSGKKVFPFQYNEIFPGLKGYKIGKHIITYQTIEDNNILIHRILHERMNIYNILKKLNPR